jgi:hypothetical protein
MRELVFEDIEALAVGAWIPPSRFPEMRRRHGTVLAIARCMDIQINQTPLRRLKRKNLLEWSLEAGVLRFPILFDRDIQESAQFRSSWPCCSPRSGSLMASAPNCPRHNSRRAMPSSDSAMTPTCPTKLMAFLASGEGSTDPSDVSDRLQELAFVARKPKSKNS